MRFALMPRTPVWWTWLVTVVLLATGLAGFTAGFLAAIAVSAAQTAFFWRKTGRVRAISVQIRLSYTLLLLVCYLPPFRVVYWLPAAGTIALLMFGYCLMSRLLSLLPWNRREPLSLDLIRRTLLRAPRVPDAGLWSACGEEGGVCELEARVADQPRTTA